MMQVCDSESHYLMLLFAISLYILSPLESFWPHKELVQSPKCLGCDSSLYNRFYFFCELYGALFWERESENLNFW